MNPARMALFDLSSSWVTGRCCELAARGYSRDGKKGSAQIEYGLLTDPAGRPVAVRVFPGNTADPDAFTEIVTVMRDTFGLAELVLVGDRGMITSARIAALRELNDDPDTARFRLDHRAARPGDRHTGRRGRAAADVPVRHPGPGRDHPPRLPRRTADRLPQPGLAAERARKRDDCSPPPRPARHDHRPRRRRPARRRGRDRGRGRQGDRQVQDGQALSPHDHRHQPDRARRHDQIAAEAALDGIYVLRTSVPADRARRPGVVAGYKNLAHVERDFRNIKADDLDLRPIHHHLDDRVRAHVLICMLAHYLIWHLRRAWAPLTYTDEHPPPRDNPVAPAPRSPDADPKASRHTTPRPTRAQLPRPARAPGHPDPQPDRYHRHQHRNPHARRATPNQRRAFDLIGAPIPLTATRSQNNHPAKTTQPPAHPGDSTSHNP